MKILVIGGGGREHALVWKIAQSPAVKKIYCAPGNAGIAQQAECVPLMSEDGPAILSFAEKEKIDLTVVGPEAPLVGGLVDAFQERGRRIFGATRRAAEIEGSKAFAKYIMKKYGIPSGDFQVFTEYGDAVKYVKETRTPLVIKADGLAAGKGVLLCPTAEESMAALNLIMVQKAFGDAGKKVVVEEFLQGEEASFLAFTDGEAVLPLPSSQDHKPIFDQDQGPNTGGMGAYSPAPVVNEKVHRQVMEQIMVPTVRGMAEEGRRYQGVLYAGLMIQNEKAKVLEFNARFGDPETQPLLLRMKSDLVSVLEATIDGDLSTLRMDWDERPAVCVVMAMQGYPGPYEKGKEIFGLREAGKNPGIVVFHAGTARKEGKIVTQGGRVLGVTAIGGTLGDAIRVAYEAAEKISWGGVYFRKDIGQKALRREVKK